ncbi:MAG TPA: SIS domain-containing protein [Ktedonobacteraceae bacterium]|jgi:D-sedoheptulose 7-phosphate isomerase
MTEQDLWALLTARFEQSTSLPLTFLSAEAEKIAAACQAMARRFHQGGRLLAMGSGPFATDAQHISVEFVHPVILGKRALPALALTNDSTVPGTALPAGPFARHLRVLARAQDIALGFLPGGADQAIIEALAVAQELGLLTLGLAGQEVSPSTVDALDFCFAVPSCDLLLIQEVHETLYHILWELVHIFLEHEGLLS